MTSLVSAEILIQEQPRDLYNLGEVVNIPVKVSSLQGLTEFFSMQLICNGVETEINKQFVVLNPGEEKQISAAIPLSTQYIPKSSGICTVKAMIGEQSITTNEFSISNHITIEIEDQQTEIFPGEQLVVEGIARKENGETVEGFVELNIAEVEVSASDTVKQGYFFINKTIPKGIAAGQYLTNLKIYERDSKGNISNTGFVDYSVRIRQVPTSLEIVFDDEAIPGEDLKVKAVLHDQTGEKIESDAEITIKNENDKILAQEDLGTDEFLAYYIPYNQPVAEWNIIAESNDLEAEESFNITEKEFAEIDIVNKTVIIMNRGNVPYNESVVIKIGNDTTDIQAYIEVDGEAKYSLSAPEGNYSVEVRSKDEKLSRTVMLTGNTIKVNEMSSMGWVRLSLVWMFIIGILGFMVYMIHKKGYKKAFIGYIQKRRVKKSETDLNKAIQNDTISKNKAELSLSIKGEKQDISLICLKLKNQKEIINNVIVQEELTRMTRLAEKEKAVVYKNQDSIFFLFVPIRTRTFKNQGTAARVAEEMKKIIERYNKTAKQKIDFGISMNYGTIVAKDEKSSLKFMSMGTLITSAKKLARLSDGNIYLTKSMNEKLLTEARTEKHQKEGTEVYTIKEMRVKGEHNKKFINNFVKKLEKDNQNKSK